jgi:hypothetical protein
MPHARCASGQAASSAARGTSAAQRRVAQQAKPRLGHLLALLALATRSLLGSRAMAAVDVSRVVALSNKAATLASKGQYARTAEIHAEAVTAAQALHQPDCLIVAHLQAAHADALLAHANTAGVPAARRAELMRFAFLELLPAAMASLQRRMAAGTLLAGACRPYEVAWNAAKTVHANALMAKTPNAAAAHVPPTAEAISAWSAYVGYDAYMRTAGIALQLCSLAPDVDAARTPAEPAGSDDRNCVQRVCGARLRHDAAAHGGF